MSLSEAQKSLLHQAFIKLDKTSPVLPSPEKATEDIASVLDISELINAHKVHYGAKAERESLLIQIITFRYSVLSLTIRESKGPDFFLLKSFMIQISNSISSIVLLTENGFEYQAISQIRNLLELLMMLIVLVESPQKRIEAIKVHNPDEARKVWHKYFSKTQFMKLIKKHAGMDSDLVDWIENTYKFLSSFSHNDYANILLFSLSDGDDEQTLHLNLLGNCITRKGKIYNNLISAIMPFDIMLFSLLRNEKIDINMDDLCNVEDDPFHSELGLTLNTLRDICMILYADIRNQKEIE